MKSSQLIAWLMCLLLAFFATVMSILNAYRLTVTQQRIADRVDPVVAQNALLVEVRDLLGQLLAERREGSVDRGATGNAVTPPSSPEGAESEGDAEASAPDVAARRTAP